MQEGRGNPSRHVLAGTSTSLGRAVSRGAMVLEITLWVTALTSRLGVEFVLAVAVSNLSGTGW